MKIFLDSSSLFKLYHPEEGTENLDGFIKSNEPNTIYISFLTTVEIRSAAYRRLRMGETTESVVAKLLRLFQNDLSTYRVIPFSDLLLESSKKLVDKHWQIGLRTLDAIQLASALQVKEELDRALTSDNTLKSIMETEGLTTDF